MSHPPVFPPFHFFFFSLCDVVFNQNASFTFLTLSLSLSLPPPRRLLFPTSYSLTHTASVVVPCLKEERGRDIAGREREREREDACCKRKRQQQGEERWKGGAETLESLAAAVQPQSEMKVCVCASGC